MNSRNITLILGVIFGLLMIYKIEYYVPCGILLLINGIHTFEFSNRKKKELEDKIYSNIKEFEMTVDNYQKEVHKLKTEFESLKMKINVSNMYGPKA